MIGNVAVENQDVQLVGKIASGCRSDFKIAVGIRHVIQSDGLSGNNSVERVCSGNRRFRSREIGLSFDDFEIMHGVCTCLIQFCHWHVDPMHPGGGTENSVGVVIVFFLVYRYPE